MAKPKKVSTEEIKEEKPVVKESLTTEKSKVKMLRTYIGPSGFFYAGSVYELEGKLLADLLKNKDAIKC